MCQFVETIRIERGLVYNLNYHAERMNRTRALFWPDEPSLNLSESLQLSENMQLAESLQSMTNMETIKCRVVYSRWIEDIQYMPYQIRPVHSLQIVNSDNIDYTYKSTDRSAINELYARRRGQDDILIVRNGLLTDTSIANVALFNGKEWHTPKRPLLKGVQRAALIDKGVIKEKEISIDRLFDYSQICLFNAMIEFGRIKIDVNRELIRI